ncbi:MAG TPA: hypothetical protein VK714_05800 [Myxococcota bacterium]|nr:hypothetical protein [Myxococcota bacterium]
MKSWVAGAIILLSLPPNASALRGILPGAACDAIPEAEAKLGSGFLGSWPTETAGDAQLCFEGHSHGGTALISYHCVSGRVESQLITLKVDSEREGYVAFSDWHRDLVSELGPPLEDIDEPSASALSDATGIPTRRHAVWVRKERRIIVTFQSAGERAWEVIVSGP